MHIEAGELTLHLTHNWKCREISGPTLSPEVRKGRVLMHIEAGILSESKQQATNLTQVDRNLPNKSVQAVLEEDMSSKTDECCGYTLHRHFDQEVD